MPFLFISINQIVNLDQIQAVESIRGQNGKDLSVQFSFLVKSGSIGFRVGPENFVEGGMEVNDDGNVSVKIFGIVKVKVYEMQETQITSAAPLYIEGVFPKDSYRCIPAIARVGEGYALSDGFKHPLAAVQLGFKKSGMMDYPKK